MPNVIVFMTCRKMQRERRAAAEKARHLFASGFRAVATDSEDSDDEPREGEGLTVEEEEFINDDMMGDLSDDPDFQPAAEAEDHVDDGEVNEAGRGHRCERLQRGAQGGDGQDAARYRGAGAGQPRQARPQQPQQQQQQQPGRGRAHGRVECGRGHG